MINVKEITLDERKGKFVVNLSFEDKEGEQLKSFYDDKDYNGAWEIIRILQDVFKVSYRRIDKNGVIHPEY